MQNRDQAVRAITGVTLVMFSAKILGVLRNILQARVFGAGADVDLFTQANNYTVSLFTTVAYALCVAAVPILSRRLRQGREQAFDTADRLISVTLVGALGLTALLALLGATGAAGTLVGVPGERLFCSCFLRLLPALPVITLTYLLLALFQSMGHFTLQGSLSLLYGLALCGVLLAAGDRLTLSAYALLLSLGWLLQLAMTLPCIRKERYRFHFRPDFRLPELRLFFRTGAVTVVTSAVFLFCYLLNTRFAAPLPAGTVSAFSYAYRIYEPLTSTRIYSISIVMFPTFSRKYGELSSQEYHAYVVQVVKNALLVVLPVSALFCVFGTPVIKVLFEGGSFDAAATLRTGRLFSVYALGMAGFFMLDLLSKAYYAMEKTLTPLAVSLGIIGGCGLLNALGRLLLPKSGAVLAACSALALVAGGLFLYVRFAREGGASVPAVPLTRGAFSALLTGATAAFVYRRFLSLEAGKLTLVLTCGGVGLGCLLLYLLLMGSALPLRRPRG